MTVGVESLLVIKKLDLSHVYGFYEQLGSYINIVCESFQKVSKQDLNVLTLSALTKYFVW